MEGKRAKAAKKNLYSVACSALLEDAMPPQGKKRTKDDKEGGKKSEQKTEERHPEENENSLTMQLVGKRYEILRYWRSAFSEETKLDILSATVDEVTAAWQAAGKPGLDPFVESEASRDCFLKQVLDNKNIMTAFMQRFMEGMGSVEGEVDLRTVPHDEVHLLLQSTNAWQANSKGVNDGSSQEFALGLTKAILSVFDHHAQIYFVWYKQIDRVISLLLLAVHTLQWRWWIRYPLMILGMAAVGLAPRRYITTKLGKALSKAMGYEKAVPIELLMHQRLEATADCLLIGMLLTMFGFWLDWIFWYKSLVLVAAVLIAVEQHMGDPDEVSVYAPESTAASIRNMLLILSAFMLLYATWYSWPWSVFVAHQFLPNFLEFGSGIAVIVAIFPLTAPEFLSNHIFSGLGLWPKLLKGCASCYFAVCLVWYWDSWLWSIVYFALAVVTCPSMVANAILTFGANVGEQMQHVGVVGVVFFYGGVLGSVSAIAVAALSFGMLRACLKKLGWKFAGQAAEENDA